MRGSNLDLLELLKNNGELSRQMIAMVEAFKTRWQVNSFDALLECRLYSEGRIAEILAKQYAVPSVEMLQADMVDRSACARLPYHLARRYSALPLKYNDDGTLQCVFANPADQLAVKNVAAYCKVPLAMMVAQRTDIQVVISEVYPPSAILNSQDMGLE